MTPPWTWAKERWQARSTTLMRLLDPWQAGKDLPTRQDVARFAAEGYGAIVPIYVCVNELAQSTAEPRLQVVTGAPGQETVLDPDRDPLSLLLAHPNPVQSSFELLEELVTHLYVAGNAYLHKVRSGARRVVQLELLRPDRTRIVPGAQGSIQAYRYYLPSDAVGQPVPTEDVVHLKLPNPLDDYYGLSPISVLARLGDLDQQAVDFLRSVFLNRGMPAGVLKIQARVEKAERERIKLLWQEEYSGTRGWNRLAVLDGGAEYQDIGQKLNELNLDGILSQTETRCCAMFGVPPIIVGMLSGLERATYSNYNAALRSFWIETLMPLYRRLGAKLTMGLASDFGGHLTIRFDVSQVPALQEDQDSVRRLALDGWWRGMLTRNESRALVKQPPVPDGDVFNATIRSDVVPADLPGSIGGGKTPNQANIQSILLDKKVFVQVDDAHQWIIDHGYLDSEPGEESHWWHFDQWPASDVEGALTKVALEEGVIAVVGQRRTQHARHREHATAISRERLATEPEFWQILHQIADAEAERMIQDVLAAMDAAQRQVAMEELLAAVEAGDVHAAMQAIGWEVNGPLLLDKALRPHLELVFADAAQAMQAYLPEDAALGISFDLTNPRAVEWAKANAARLVTEVSTETRDAIRDTISRAISGDLGPSQAAQQIRDRIGLTTRQAQAVANLETRLTEAGTSADTIATAAARYTRQLLNYRAELIARTETITSANAGQQELWLQGVEQGLIDPHAARRHWLVTPDDRLDQAICAPIPSMNPRGVGLTEPFQTPVGPLMHPVAHPQCRCAMSLEFAGA